MKTKASLCSLFCLLALPLTLLSAPPVEVEKEYKAEVGDFVPVRAKTDGKRVTFVVLDPGLKQFPSDLLSDKKAGVFSAAKAGKYRVLAYSSVKDDPTEPAIFTVVIGTPPPTPTPPDPTPGPTPTPQPDGVLGLIKVSREAAAKLTDTVENRKKLIASQRAIASTIAAGGLTQPGEILKAWRDGNNAAVNSAVWSPWGVEVSAALSKLYSNGKLANKDNWVDAFGEIADGLEAK